MAATPEAAVPFGVSAYQDLPGPLLAPVAGAGAAGVIASSAPVPFAAALPEGIFSFTSA